MKRKLLKLLLLIVLPVSSFGQTNAWINEIHYDNQSPSGDNNEAIEIVIENVDDIANYSLELYNGGTGAEYETYTSTSFVTGDTSGNFSIYTILTPGIQNGAPDGVALIYNGAVLQFLSYEGSFTAIDGTANGMASTDIIVKETSGVTDQQSLQLSGNGSQYADFTWQDASTSSFGSLNTGQTLGAGGANLSPLISSIAIDPENPTSSDLVSVTANVVDNDGSVASVVLNWGTTSGSLTNVITMLNSSGETYVTSEDISAQANGTTVYFEIVATDNEGAEKTSDEQSYTVNDPSPPGAIIITEVMANPASVGDADGEYFEIYNTTSSAVVMDGWRVVDAGSNDHTVSSFTLGAKSFAVFGRNDDTAANGGMTVDYVLSSFSLGNTDDEIILLDENDNEIDRVEYDTSGDWEIVAGASMSFIGLADEDNNDAALWVTSAFVNGLDSDAGSPGVNGAEQFLENTSVYESGSWSDGAPSGSTSSMNFLLKDGVYNTGSSEINVQSLQVRDGAVVNIEAVLDLEGSVFNYGAFTFKSTASANGELDEINANAQLVGDFTVERFFDDYLSYRIVSPAVTTSTSIYENWQENGASPVGYGTHITGSDTGANGFDATGTGNPSMFEVDYSDVPAFAAIANTNATNLEAGNPYLLYVRGDRNIDLGGATPANRSTTLRATGALATGDQDAQIFSTEVGEVFMFGNPYQAAVDVNEVFANAGTQNVNPNFYYVYDPSIADNGAYVTVSLPAGTATPTSDADQYLQPGQGAQGETVTSAMAEVVFEENDKAVGNHADVFRSSSAVIDGETITASLYTKASYAEGKIYDGFLIEFDDDNDDARTLVDAIKISNLGENIAVVNGDNLLSVDRRTLPEEGEIQLSISNYNYSEYVLLLNVADGLGAIQLKDSYTNETIELLSGDNQINFTVSDETSKAEDRFSLVFSNTFSVNENAVSAIKIYPNPTDDGRFSISGSLLRGKQVGVKINDILGREVYNESHDLNTAELSLKPQLKTGVYLLSITCEGKTSVHKLIKK